MDKRNFTFSIPSMGLRIGIFGRLRLPLPGGIYLGGGRLILVSLSTVGLGFLASMFLLISTGDQEITWPMTGASYAAPSMIGSPVVDREFPSARSQTLKINLPAGIRLDKVTFKNISLGKIGLTDSFQIAGTSTTDVILSLIHISEPTRPY